MAQHITSDTERFRAFMRGQVAEADGRLYEARRLYRAAGATQSAIDVDSQIRVRRHAVLARHVPALVASVAAAA